ncbi:dynamin family protein [Actinomycetospora straminea]|uniref:Dynamin N-terminal domain-containing protein n=1 Tax=Actinomycetospora straminea TaxID=663607 RepID=A0ABP9EI56_9PSEU|nr:dynamin family protein [Actinomycetospora straminea]MDD7935684.1 hypothetical protein [Actinomycetospora straminea]
MTVVSADGAVAARRPLPAAGRLVAVTGAPRSGRTTVVNALLGAPAVPEGRLPCTDPTVVVRWGDRPGGHMYRSADDRPDWFSLDQLAGWAAAEVAPFMAFADVLYPSELLREVTLVDGGDPAAVAGRGRVHVVDVTAGSGPDAGATPGLLVLTKLDLVADDERDARRAAVLAPWGDVPHVVVDAPRILRALAKRNGRAYVASGGAGLLHAVRRVAQGRRAV